MQTQSKRFAAILVSLTTLSVVGCRDAGKTVDPTGPNTELPGTGSNTSTTGGTGSGTGAGPDTAATETFTYRFGAKFEPPIGRVVHGLGQWQAYNTKYTALLPQDNQPASELIFLQIGDSSRPWVPAQIGAALASIDARGRIPLADIGLRGNNLTPAQIAALPDPLYGIDDEVANGTAWDARLQDLVTLFKAFKKPMLVRIGGEFSGSWNGYHPYDYPRAFRKIVNMFRSAGVDNVAFVWCYEPAAPGDFDAQSATGAPKWYPGADVVDWFSIDLYAAGDVGGPASGHGALTPFGRTLKFLDMAVAEHKPVVIAESSPSHYDFTNPANAAWSEWFAPYFGLIATRSEIEWFVYVNYDWTAASFYLAQGWKNNDLSISAALSAAYAAEISKAKYLHSGERDKLKDYGLYK